MDWPRDLIERAHRLRAPRQDGRPRPMIVKFLRWGDAMRVLGNREARENMKREGIHLSQDYTKRQQNQLKELRAEGKQGYFLRGKLYIKSEGNRQDQNNRNTPGIAGQRGGRGRGREGGSGVKTGERGERWNTNTTGRVERGGYQGGWRWEGTMEVGGWEGGRGNGIGMREVDCDRGNADMNGSRRNEETVRQGWKDYQRKHLAQNSELSNTQWTYMMSQYDSAFSLQDEASERAGWEGGGGGGRGWKKRIVGTGGKGGQKWSGECEEGESEGRVEWERERMEGNENEATGQTVKRGEGREANTYVDVIASINKRNEGESERERENAKNENEVSMVEIEISGVDSVCSAYSDIKIQRLEDGLIVGGRKKRDRDHVEERESSGRQNEKERYSEEESEREEQNEDERGDKEGEIDRKEGEDENIVETECWTVALEETNNTKTCTHADNATNASDIRTGTQAHVCNKDTERATIQVDTNNSQTCIHLANDQQEGYPSNTAHETVSTAQLNVLSNSQAGSTARREYRQRQMDNNSTNAGGIRGRATLAKKGGEKGGRRLSRQQGGNTNKVSSTQANKQTKSSGLVQQTLRNATDRLSLGRGEEESNRGRKGGREIVSDKETTVRCGLRSQSLSNPDK